MPRIVREANVSVGGQRRPWRGTISAASSTAFTDLAFTLASRIGIPEGKTSPEELLAAAHGGCFTMSLASELSKAGTPPERASIRASS